MDAKEFAAQLNGIEYHNSPIMRAACEQAKACGLVIVYGASDDLMEFGGAITDELSCYDGGTAYLTGNGLLQNECQEDDCPYFAKQLETATTIEAVWHEGGDYSWTYNTTIPHETFDFVDDGVKYCRGIVFKLSDVAK